MRESDRIVLEEIIEARGGFGHREHLQLAWTYLQMYGPEEAADVMVAAIGHLTRLHGAEQKSHATMTRAWVHCVAVHQQRWGADGFARFLERNPELRDRTLIEQFYSRECLYREPARRAWSDPDLRALPALV